MGGAKREEQSGGTRLLPKKTEAIPLAYFSEKVVRGIEGIVYAEGAGTGARTKSKERFSVIPRGFFRYDVILRRRGDLVIYSENGEQSR